MSSRRRRFVLRHPGVVNVGCSCRRPKLPSFVLSSPQSESPKIPGSTATSLSKTTTTNANSSSSTSRSGDGAPSPSPPSFPADSSEGEKNRKCGAPTGVVERSMAVVKESSDPYLDFRDSMLQMIVETEIYAWDDLRDLLRRFLALNATRYHNLILRAFSDVFNNAFSAPAAGEAPPPLRT